MARHAVVTGAAVSMTREIQVSEEKPRVELPAWVTKFVVVVNALREWGALKGLESIHVARRDGYSLIDGFGLLLAYFCCNETGLGGLRGFCDRINQAGLSDKLAAILGRIGLPSSASLSRLLGSIEKPEIAKVIEVVGAACGRLRTRRTNPQTDDLALSLTCFQEFTGHRKGNRSCLSLRISGPMTTVARAQACRHPPPAPPVHNSLPL